MPKIAGRRPRLARKKQVKRARKQRVPRSLSINPMNQHATIVETISLNGLGVNEISFGTFALGDFPRASQTSLNYKWYKAEYVEWEYYPLFNTFQEDLPETQPTIPYILHNMNRTQDATIPSDSANYVKFMESQGAVPQKFTKKVVLRYKPNWCSPGLQSVNVNPATGSVIAVLSSGLTTNYGWLMAPNSNGVAGNVAQVAKIVQPSTQSNIVSNVIVPNVVINTQYNGHTLLFQQDTAGTSKVADLVCRVKWVFKGPAPYWVTLREPPPSKLPEPMVLDA